MSKALEIIKKIKEEEREGNWRVWTYDVWGNAEDGYEVNDRTDQGYLDLPDNPTDEQIVKALINHGVLNNNVKVSDVEIGGDDMSITVDAADDSYPLAGLEKEE
jgi:predicted NAD/FAD-dependent oxidoreductase